MDLKIKNTKKNLDSKLECYAGKNMEKPIKEELPIPGFLVEENNGFKE